MRFGAILICLLAMAPGLIRGQSWVLKVSGPGLGNPLTSNPLLDDILYGAAGSNKVWVSRDRGYSWSQYGSVVPGGGIVKSVCVNSPDTLQVIVGVESNSSDPDRILKSVDGGMTWNQTWSGTFSYYGQPLEFTPAHPDTVYTMGLDTVYRSVDFGSTWDTVCTGRGFNAWCDAALRPDSAAVMYVGDNLSGIWKTADHGASWRKVYSTLGEIPCISVDPLTPRVAYAGKFGGGGGLVKTTDWGETWHPLTVPSGNRDAWWVTCSRVHPGYVYYGTYTGDTSYLGIYFSRDAGATWTRINAGLGYGAWFNYGLLALDSLTVIALQSNGIYKYQYPTLIGVESPNGGEVLRTDSAWTIRWNAVGIYAVRIEYSTDGGNVWSAIADSVPAGAGAYPWTVPDASSDSCLIRISDAGFTAAADVSDGPFTIARSPITVVSPNGGEEWDAGSIHEVAWTSFVSDTLVVDYSPDAGSTWTNVTRVLSGEGAFAWTVPDDPTGSALIRVGRAGDTTSRDASDSAFSILSPRTFSARIAFADAGTGRDTLVLGNAAGATDGIDTLLGEAELSVPFPGILDVRWAIDGTNGSRTDYRDTLAGPGDLRRFVAVLQPGPGGYPFTLAWAPESLRAGTFIIRDAAGGGAYGANMRAAASVVVPSAGSGVEILQCPSVPVVVPGNGGWLMVSLPSETGDRRAASLFPRAYTGAFTYDLGYVKCDTLEPGLGYWIRTERTTVVGCPAPVGPVRVKQGWNMVGAPGSAIPAGAVGSSPESLIVSPIFRFGEGGYSIADSLKPGEAYWVKCSDTGALLFGSVGSRAVTAAFSGLPARPPVVLWASAGGRTRHWYFGPSDRPRTMEWPPAPPGSAPSEVPQNAEFGAFHPDSLNYPIEYPLFVKSTENKLFFSWEVEIQEKFDYILIENAGTQEVSSTRLTGEGAIEFSVGPSSNYLLRVLPRVTGSDRIPEKFAIGGWYPNPFNPTTRVSLTVPSESEVSYKVYNLLGEIVSSSVSHTYPAGEHLLEWSAVRNDGTSLGSGVYFIELTAAVRRGDHFGPGQTYRVVSKVALVR